MGCLMSKRSMGLSPRAVLIVGVLTLGSGAGADDGNRIDRCWLDDQDALHCSTPNRRAAAVNKLIFAGVDERQEFVRQAAVAWATRQKGECRAARISVLNVFNAYNAPGVSDGSHIKELDDKCERDFA